MRILCGDYLEIKTSETVVFIFVFCMFFEPSILCGPRKKITASIYFKFPQTSVFISLNSTNTYFYVRTNERKCLSLLDLPEVCFRYRQ